MPPSDWIPSVGDHQTKISWAATGAASHSADADANAIHPPSLIAMLRRGPAQVEEQRLSLAHEYDVIVIGKISWVVIPPSVRSRILEHVARGSGLVYVTPHRLKEGYDNRTVVADARDESFGRLFEMGGGGALAGLAAVRSASEFK